PANDLQGNGCVWFKPHSVKLIKNAPAPTSPRSCDHGAERTEENYNAEENPYIRHRGGRRAVAGARADHDYPGSTGQHGRPPPPPQLLKNPSSTTSTIITIIPII